MKKLGIFFLLLLAVPALQAGTRGQLRQGGKFYNNQKYGSALNVYQNILKKNPNDQRALFNAANAYYRLNEYTQAEDLYKKASQQTGDYAQSALYNLGNAYYKAGDKEQAKGAYQQALLQNPQDKEAAHNLQLLLQEEQQNKNDNQQNDDNQNNQSSNQNQQNQDGKGQSQSQPDSQQSKQNQLSQQDADRVMAMAKENEHKPSITQNKNGGETVEKDW